METKMNPPKSNVSNLFSDSPTERLSKVFCLIILNLFLLTETSFGQCTVTVGQQLYGGVVFYVDPNGQSGLVAAPFDQVAGCNWGCQGTLLAGANGTVVGTGFANSEAIVNSCSTVGVAAQLCRSLNINGYTDWYLPSADELNLLYLQKNTVGGFVANSYWTSSQFSANDAYLQNFNSGIRSHNLKNQAPAVRAIRSFNVSCPCSGAPSPGNTLSNLSVLCNGGSATLSLQNNPASTGLVYQWQYSLDGLAYLPVPNATDSIYFASNLTSSIYFNCIVTCSNSGLSSVSIPILVTVSPKIIILDSITPCSFPGFSDGSISIGISGGVGPYNSVWSTGTTYCCYPPYDSISGLSAGAYSVTVVDANGCSLFASYDVKENIHLDSMVFSPLGNAILSLDTIDDDIVISTTYTGNNTTDLFGIFADIPMTDGIGIASLPATTTGNAQYVILNTVNSDTLLNINSTGTSFNLSSTQLSLANITVSVFNDGVLTGSTPLSSLSLSKTSGGDPYGLNWRTDSIASTVSVTLIFDAPVEVNSPPDTATLDGNEITFTIPNVTASLFNAFAFLSNSGTGSFEITDVLLHVPTDDSVPVLPTIDTTDYNILPATNPNDPFIYVSSAVMSAITDWTNVVDSSGVSLTYYLQQQSMLDQSEVTSFISAFYAGYGSSCPCYCKPVRVNPALKLIPSTKTLETDNGHKGRTWYWDRFYSKLKYGAAYRNDLRLNGIHKSTSVIEDTDTHEASYDVLYVCVNDQGIKTNCCSQTLNINAIYDSKLYVYNDGRGIKIASQSQAEDGVSLVAYDWNSNMNFQVLKAARGGAANNYKQNWNPQFVVSALTLTAAVVSAVIAPEITPAIVSGIATAMGNTLTTNPLSVTGTRGVHSTSFTMSYNGNVTLLPNVRKTIQMISKGHVIANGNGGRWWADAKIASDFMLAVELAHNSSPQCCVKKSARWALASMPDAPNTAQTLRDAVGSFLFLDRPWFDGVNNSALTENIIPGGRMNVNSDFGLVYGNDQCTSCLSSPINISGTVAYSCQSLNYGSVTLNVADGTAPYSFLWSNGATTQNLVGLNSGTYTVVVTDANSLTNSISFQVTEPLPLTITSNLGAILCYGGTTQVNISANGGVAPYIGTGVFQASAGSATYTVFDSRGCSTSITESLTQPSKVEVTMTAIDANCSGSNGQAFANANGGVPPYNYLWSSNALNQTSTSISGLAPGTYTVVVNDQNGCSSNGSVTVGNSTNSLPSAPGQIVGSVNVCRNSSGLVYTVTPVLGATAYLWTLPNGATGSSSSHSISLSFSSTFSGGFMSVAAANACGIGPASSVNIAVVATYPSQPSPIVGPSIACGPQTLTYSTSATNALSYTWSVTGGITILSGQGTNSISVSLPGGFNQGSIQVFSSNCYSNSAVRGIVVTGNPSLQAVTGPTFVCANNTATYSTPVVTGATTYVWTVSGNATLGATTLTNTTSTQVINFGPAWTSGIVTVTGSNACGSSSRSFTVFSTPSQPGAITGLGTGLCGLSNQVYSISPVASATSYMWTVPSGVTINSTTGLTANLSFTPAFTSASATICVAANNACGSSPQRCFTVTSRPGIPIISGPDAVCKTNSAVNYSASSSTAVTAWNWSTIGGASIIPLGSSATVNFNSSLNTSVSVRASASNTCGTGQPGQKIVAVNFACRAINDQSNLEAFTLFPNPTSSKTNIVFNATDMMNCDLTIVDALGQIVMLQHLKANTGENLIEFDMEEFQPGIYSVLLNCENGSYYSARLILE